MASCVEPKPPVKSFAVPRLVMTPGCSVASCMKLRPLSGSSAIWCVVTTPPLVVEPSETLLVSPATVTCSVTPPMIISMSTSRSLPIATVS